jgi:flagellar basal body L-ring protein FlgH
MTKQLWGLRHAMKRLAAIVVLIFCGTIFCVPAGAQKDKPAYPESRAQRRANKKLEKAQRKYYAKQKKASDKMFKESQKKSLYPKKKH